MQFGSATLNPVNIPALYCRVLAFLSVCGLAACGPLAKAQDSSGSAESGEIRIVAVQGTVEVMSAGAGTWVLTQTNQLLYPGDRLRTDDNSRVTILWSDKSVVPLGPLTQIEILAQDKPSSLPGLDFLKGVLSFFHRDQPGRIRVLTHGANASIEGTEFVMRASEVNGVEQDTLSVMDGKVLFSNSKGSILLTNDQQAVVEPGKAPVRTPGFIANNILQWCFYYPAVLDPEDLPLTRDEQQLLAPSLDAYRAGNLLAALGKYPELKQPESDSERIYHAALLLSVGEVEQTESELAGLSMTSQTDWFSRLISALHTLIAAVKRQPKPTSLEPKFATEWLAASYYEQSQATGDESLSAALSMARQAAALSPQFGFAWERIAELEFSFGRRHESEAALDKSLAFSPQNAQAQALKGFLLSSQNRINDAISWFNRAIATDGALGNAWLGRGLCRIRRGDTAGGLHDLLIAAATEPQRSLLRSYLGKAYADTWQDKNASMEFRRAEGLDPNDPTPWLYSALQNSGENKVNGAVNDLETSIALNDNRAVYRSQLLLDQDKASRSANLATVYNDAGMAEISVDEASKSVIDDYGNFSAHLFLANSYNELRDPNLINLRYESATFSEYLLANLLSPVGGSKLSSYVSQQDYSELFDQEGPHVSSQSTYLSSGDWLQQGALYGWQKNTAYAATVYYRSQASEPGRVNNDLQQYGVSANVKQQLTLNDSAYVEADFSGLKSGDVRQYYDQSFADPNLRVSDHQTPNLYLGYNHEWSPEIHTLFLAGRLEDRFNLSDRDVSIPAVITNGDGGVVDTMEHFAETIGVPGYTNVDTFDSLDSQSHYVVYSAELQQIAEISKHTLVVGGRYQNGEITTDTEQQRARGGILPIIVINPTTDITEFSAAQDNRTALDRLSFYGYDQWQIFSPLWLTAGVSYDWLRYPENVDAPPISDNEQTATRVSPKAGFVWTPATDTTVRGAFTRSLGGLSYDTSVRLEPVQVAGFDQAYRSVTPESVEGSVPGSRFQTFDLGFEQKFKSRTYLDLQLELLQSDASLGTGAFIYDPNIFPANYVGQTQISQDLKYRERSAALSVNQLVGRDLAFGAHYRVSDADLKTDYPDLPATLFPPTHQNALLHTLDLDGFFNHPSGFFAEVQALWRRQSNFNDDANLPGDNFWQFNVFAGWRFAHRHAELTVGLLNLGNQNYHLNPLNLYDELPRNRTAEVSLQFIF